jgi:hypothetical protein
MITTGTAGYAMQDEKPTKPNKYCYIVFYLDEKGTVEDIDKNCYAKKQHCEENRSNTIDDDVIITESSKVEREKDNKR